MANYIDEQSKRPKEPAQAILKASDNFSDLTNIYNFSVAKDCGRILFFMSNSLKLKPDDSSYDSWQ